MIESEKTLRYTLPQIRSVKFSNFDLYTEQPNVSVPINKGVFCLIGANGLGKTTFLNTLIFGLTGAVPDPARKFLSAQKYYREASRSEKTADYFEGRISEHNRSTASVTIVLEWSMAKITVTRSFFDGGEITELVIAKGDSEEHYNSGNTDSVTDLNGIYAKHINELTGLKEYTQFVFLVHFVLTFDEGRHLLMWDDAALTDALYLAFGGDPEFARKADKLREDMNRADSKGRNTKYAAKLVADKMKVLAEATASEVGASKPEESTADIQRRHADLIERCSETEKRLGEKRVALQDIDLKWTEASSSLSEAQIEYQKLFSKYFERTSSAHYHPLIKASLSEDKCAVCSTPGVSKRISTKLTVGSCPLCDSALEKSVAKDSDTNQLKDLDKRIAKLRQVISSLLEKRDRVDAEYQAAVSAAEAAKDELSSFEDEVDVSLLKGSSGGQETAVEEEIKKLKRQHDELTKESKTLYKRRDEIRKEMRELEARLRRQYDEAAKIFVPRFRDLAEAFIGLDIDIQLKQHQTATKSGFGLTLSMGGEPRQRSVTVSESQGFFIDIALRMALAEYMCDGPATLLIDTPEGSLDIAYEARAGAMFAKFTEVSNRILMTANLRSSELVLRLAKILQEHGMQVEKMTEWTELSAVQKEEEGLFQGAYDSIASALGGGS